MGTARAQMPVAAPRTVLCMILAALWLPGACSFGSRTPGAYARPCPCGPPDSRDRSVQVRPSIRLWHERAALAQPNVFDAGSTRVRSDAWRALVARGEWHDDLAAGRTYHPLTAAEYTLEDRRLDAEWAHGLRSWKRSFLTTQNVRTDGWTA